MKDDDYSLAGRVVCCGSLVLLGWWLRGSLGAKTAQQGAGTHPPAARLAFALDAAPVASAERVASAAPVVSATPVASADLMASVERSASAPVDFVEPPTLPKPYPNHTAAASVLGNDPTLASQASAADLSKGSVLDADG